MNRSSKILQWGCAAASGLALTIYNRENNSSSTSPNDTTSTTQTSISNCLTSIATSIIHNKFNIIQSQNNIAECSPLFYANSKQRSKPNKKKRPKLKSLNPTYEVGRVIGTGGFGSVRHGYHVNTNQPVALKFLSKTETTRNELDVEVELQRAVHAHVGVNKIVDVVETSKEWVIVMEYLSGGELFDKLIASGAYSEREASKALRTVCGTIAHLHKRGIVHGDIKPENIMLHHEDHDGYETELELIDFGMAFRLQHDEDIETTETTASTKDNNNNHNNHNNHNNNNYNNYNNNNYNNNPSSSSSSRPSTLKKIPSTIPPRLPIDLLIRKREKKRQRRMTNAHRLGTTAYAPPEVLQAHPVGEGVDMWALGVIMYILLTGTHPFDLANDATDEEIESNIIQSRLKFDDPVWEEVTPSAIELIRLLLSPDPHDRPSAEDAMEHPWMDEDNAQSLHNEPLTEVAENLLKYQKGRTYLRASVLAVLLGIADETAHNNDSNNLRSSRLPAQAGRQNDESLDGYKFRRGSNKTKDTTPEYVDVDPFLAEKMKQQIQHDSDTTSSLSTTTSLNNQNQNTYTNDGDDLINLNSNEATTHVINEKSNRNTSNNNTTTTNRAANNNDGTTNSSRRYLTHNNRNSTNIGGHRGGAYSSAKTSSTTSTTPSSSTTSFIKSPNTTTDPLVVSFANARKGSRRGPRSNLSSRSGSSSQPSNTTREVYGRLRRFDRDNKGFIDHNDLRLVTSELGEKLTEQELSDMTKVGIEAITSNNSREEGYSDSDRRTAAAARMANPKTKSKNKKKKFNKSKVSVNSSKSNSTHSSTFTDNGEEEADDEEDKDGDEDNDIIWTQTNAPPPALAHRDIQRVLTSLRTQRFNHGDLIFRQGEVERIFHLLVSGKVQMTATTSQGKEVTVNYVLPGEHFGVWELMHSETKAKPRRKTGRCVAEDGCEVLTLPQSDFKILTETFGNVRERMHGQLRLRTREMLRHYLKEEVADYKEEVYEKGQVIYEQGDECDSLFLVLEGEVAVTRETINESKHIKSTIVEELSAGDFFPLGVLGIGTFRKSTRGATVKATEHGCRVARVNGSEFRAFQDKHRGGSDETHEKHVVDDLHEDVIERHEKRAQRAGYDAKLINDDIV